MTTKHPCAFSLPTRSLDGYKEPNSSLHTVGNASWDVHQIWEGVIGVCQRFQPFMPEIQCFTVSCCTHIVSLLNNTLSNLHVDIYFGLNPSQSSMAMHSSPFLTIQIRILSSVAVDAARSSWNALCTSCCSGSNFSLRNELWVWRKSFSLGFKSKGCL